MTRLAMVHHHHQNVKYKAKTAVFLEGKFKMAISPPTHLRFFIVPKIKCVGGHMPLLILFLWYYFSESSITRVKSVKKTKEEIQKIRKIKADIVFLVDQSESIDKGYFLLNLLKLFWKLLLKLKIFLLKIIKNNFYLITPNLILILNSLKFKTTGKWWQIL